MSDDNDLSYLSLTLSCVQFEHKVIPTSIHMPLRFSKVTSGGAAMLSAVERGVSTLEKG